MSTSVRQLRLSRNRLRAFLFQSGEKPVVSTIELERKID